MSYKVREHSRILAIGCAHANYKPSIMTVEHIRRKTEAHKCIQAARLQSAANVVTRIKMHSLGTYGHPTTTVVNHSTAQSVTQREAQLVAVDRDGVSFALLNWTD